MDAPEKNLLSKLRQAVHQYQADMKGDYPDVICLNNENFEVFVNMVPAVVLPMGKSLKPERYFKGVPVVRSKKSDDWIFYP